MINNMHGVASDYKYLMIITCKETDENIHELYGDDKAALQREFENEYGELYCIYEIFETAENEK